MGLKKVTDLARGLGERLSRLADFPFRYVLGDDIFISYSRDGGATYAAGIADELAGRQFASRIDQWGTESGEKMPASLRRKLRRSAILVLVGTPSAAKSGHVAEEVAVMKRLRRHIVPIIFDGVVLWDGLSCRGGALVRGAGEAHAPALWANDIRGLPLSCEKPAGVKVFTDSPDALVTGEPAPEIVNRIDKTFTFARKDQRQARATALVSVLLLAMLAAGGGAGSLAYIWNERAEQKTLLAEQRTREAEAAEGRAREAQAEAAASTKEARRAGFEAASSQIQAAAEGHVADREKRRAEEQTRLASEADRRRAEAESAEREAGERAEAANAKAGANLARVFYNHAQAEAATNPLHALLWTQRAVETAPPSDARAAFYRLRMLHLTAEAPSAVVNDPGLPTSARFSPALDKAVTTASLKVMGQDYNRVRGVWRLKTGERLPDPLAECRCRYTLLEGPVFSPDGRWLAALVAGENVEENWKGPVLLVWDAETGERRRSLKVEGRGPNAVWGRKKHLAFSPDSGAVMLGYQFTKAEQNRHRVRQETLVWEHSTGEAPKVIPSNYPKVWLGDDPERNWLLTAAAGEGGHAAQVWDISTGALVRTLPHEGEVERVLLAREGGRILTVSRAGGGARQLRVWDAETGVSAPPLPLAEFAVEDVSPAGDRLIVRAPEGAVGDGVEFPPGSFGVWNLRGGRPTPLPAEAKHRRVIFSADGEYVISESAADVRGDTRLEVREADTLAPARPPTLLRKEDSAELHLSDRMLVGALSRGGVLTVRDLARREGGDALPVERLPLGEAGPPSRVLAAPGLGSFLTVSGGGAEDEGGAEDDDEGEGEGEAESVAAPRTMQLWSAETGGPLWRPGGVEAAGVTPLGFSADGRHFVTSESAPDSSRVIRVRRASDGGPAEGFRPIPLKAKEVYAAAFGPGGEELVTAHREDFRPQTAADDVMRVERWDASTGRPSPGGTVEIASATPSDWPHAFSRRAEYLIAIDEPGDAYVEFHVYFLGGGGPGRATFSFPDHGTAALAVALLTQADAVAVAREEKVIRASFGSGLTLSLKVSDEKPVILGLEAEPQVRAPYAGVGDHTDIRFSPDGKLVVTRRPGDGALRLWDTRTGLLVSDRLWHEGAVRSFEFTPGGDRLVTVTAEGRVRSWYVGGAGGETPPWMSRSAEALTGMRLLDDARADGAPQADYAALRCRYLRALRAAGEHDERARYVLSVWRPWVGEAPGGDAGPCPAGRER